MTPPPVIVFDVNETLSDMAPLARRFTDLGAPAHLAPLWFASVLRDAFALTAAGASERFAVIADAQVRTVLHDVAVDRDPDAAVAHVLEGFAALDVHADVVDGVRALRAAGFRLATLSNGATEVAETLLSRAGIREHFDRVLSVEDAGVWKPAPGSYAYAARELGVDRSELVLVAVHPWDVDGAARAGCGSAYLDRTARPYPAHLRRPDHVVTSVGALAGALAD
ncbi:haloacid dehalogenase type II [Pseudonocardia broussonetiae]|uniref:Haloacid dehalogenase type II n=1 Tax=Pseudonocardia broussonetiae TaxID=2736640 RepID=A0A6M6JL38_9PSEU|nr:haloacid dehalogenase type II [Pseudonocardia broussonetiae]QJY47995.1 haloacid dehalogenase type II [Pseudonocardia broussonetiae]